MSGRWILREQIGRAFDDLRAVGRLLDESEPAAGSRANAHPHFRNRSRRVHEGLRGLREGLEASAAETSWRELATLRARLDRLIGDTLAYLQGLRLRADGFDGGVCSLADALVDEIAGAAGIPWTGFTIPGGRVLIDIRANMIGLPFPQVGLWDLPMVAHELGHYATRFLWNELGLEPLRAALDAEPDARRRSHLEELFADVFGTYVMGPSALCTALLLRFNPGSDLATTGSTTHPSFEQRADWMLRTLDRTGRRGDRPPPPEWLGLVDEVRAAWSEGLALAAPEGESGQAVPDSRFDEVFSYVEERANARYASWKRAIALADVLDPEGEGSAPREEVSRRDLLNAAWLARLNRPEAEHNIALGTRARLDALPVRRSPSHAT